MVRDGFKLDQFGDYIEKLPGSVLDYGFLFEDWLKGEIIVSSTWTLPVGLVEVSSSYDNTSTAVVISGGVAGSTYVVTNTITTAALTDSRSFRILCV